MFIINCGLILSIFHLFPSYAYEYCSQEEYLCGNKQHIACMQAKNYGRPIDVTPYTTKRMRSQILDEHNHLRSKIACGNLFDANDESYPQAAQMYQLTWDFELEYLASLTVRHCNELEDVCQNTFRFRDVGRNTGIISIPEVEIKDFDPITSFSEIISTWFEQHLRLNRSNIEKLSITEEEYIDYLMDAERTTFLLMASDQIKQIGCSLTYCAEDDNWLIYMVCNYSDDIEIGGTIYEVGEPGEGCKIKSKTYHGLCEGEIKPYRMS